MMAREKIEFEESSGNVFIDLGFSEEEAEELAAKAELARQIGKAIASRHMTQAAAAKALHIDRSKVSKIVNGHLDDFAIGRLMVFLRRLDRQVDILVSTKARRGARLRVKAA